MVAARTVRSDLVSRGPAPRRPGRGAGRPKLLRAGTMPCNRSGPAPEVRGIAGTIQANVTLTLWAPPYAWERCVSRASRESSSKGVREPGTAGPAVSVPAVSAKVRQGRYAPGDAGLRPPGRPARVGRAGRRIRDHRACRRQRSRRADHEHVDPQARVE